MENHKIIWLVANWKSNKTIAEALDWVSIVGPNIPKNDPPAHSGLSSSGLKTGGLKVVLCPTFSCLAEVKKAVQVGNFPIIVGSQDLSPYNQGAYTGEESATLLKDLVNLSILGHCERRQNFSETDGMISKKVDQAIQNNITPLVCVQSLDTLVPEQCKLVAYEPIFAIGTGNPDTPENADNMAKALKEKYPGLEVLYGGSLTHDNIKNFINMPNISGVLIGKASLDPQEFNRIISLCQE